MTALKKKRNQSDTRAKLLKAALDVFAKEGYDAATTRSIAKRAGVNESLIHRYFESKHGLFIALKDQFRENWIQRFLADDEGATLEEDLTRFIKSRLQSTPRDKKFFRLSISRAILDPKVRADVRNASKFKEPQLVERFDRFRRKGQIRQDIDMEHVVAMIQVFAFSFSILMDAIECISPAEAEQMIKTAVQTMCEGLHPRG